jgi:hypothetical protein
VIGTHCKGKSWTSLAGITGMESCCLLLCYLMEPSRLFPLPGLIWILAKLKVANQHTNNPQQKF